MENTALIIIDMQDGIRTYRPLERNATVCTTVDVLKLIHGDGSRQGATLLPTGVRC